jgi:hypothetical protein
MSDLKKSNKHKQQMRDAKVQEVSRQLFEINRDTRSFLGQPPDDKNSFDIALNNAKELDQKVYEHYGSDESRYRAEMDKHIHLKRRALEETMKTPLPQIVQSMKESLPRFLQLKKQSQDSNQQVPKLLNHIIDFISQMNQTTPTEAIQKLFLFYIAPMKIRNDDSNVHRPTTTVQPSPQASQPAQQLPPVQPEATNIPLTEEQKLEITQIIADISQSLNDVMKKYQDKEPKPELQDMFNFLKSLRSTDISQKDFPSIQQYYREKCIPNLKKLKENPKAGAIQQLVVIIQKLVESVSELKTIVEHENQSIPIPQFAKKYIKVVDSIPAVNSISQTKQNEIMQIYKKYYPQVIQYLQNVKATVARNIKPTAPSTPLQETPILSRAPSVTQIKQLPPISPVQVTQQPKEQITDEDRLEMVKKFFTDVKTRTSIFRVNPYPIFYQPFLSTFIISF